MTAKKKFLPYLLWSFGIAWVLQLIASWFYAKGNNTAYTVMLTITMFSPFAAALLSGNGLKTMGWKPALKKNWKMILVAWILPIAMTATGAALYYLLVPAAFDSSMGYLTSQLGEEAIAQLESSGMTLQLYIVVSVVPAMIYGPFVNMFVALGEEVGWRGVMYPELRKRFGTLKGRILGGVIWGAWHWPIMIFAGYEYGKDYWGAPFTGMILFCVFTVAAGIFLDWIYEKTNCIWLPSLGHGALNACAGIPLYWMNTAYADRLLLGPAMIGVIGGLPMLVAAVLICLKKTSGNAAEAPAETPAEAGEQ